jgi:hypothetical protein
MFRKTSFLLALLSASTLMASAPDFLLDVTYTQPIPTGPITSVANIGEAADAQGNLYILENGLTGACQPIGSPRTQGHTGQFDRALVIRYNKHRPIRRRPVLQSGAVRDQGARKKGCHHRP